MLTDSDIEVFTQVTLQMSHSKTPTLPWVLPMYEHMDRHLKKHIADDSQLPLLRVAAVAGMQKLNKYHTMARDCQYNVIATRMYLSIHCLPISPQIFV